MLLASCIQNYRKSLIKVFSFRCLQDRCVLFFYSMLCGKNTRRCVKHEISEKKLRLLNFLFFTAMEQKSVSLIYWAAERKCRQFTERMVLLMLYQQFSYVFALLFSIYCICVGNFDTSTYYLPLRIAPPFNVDPVYRWYLFLVLQFISGVTYMATLIASAVHFVCGCYYLAGLCDHFNYFIEMVDAEFRQNRSQANERVTVFENSLRSRKLLCDAIDHHNKIYEWVFSGFTIFSSLNYGNLSFYAHF